MRITKQVLSAGALAATVATLALTGGTPAQAAGTARRGSSADTIQYFAGSENNRIMLERRSTATS